MIRKLQGAIFFTISGLMFINMAEVQKIDLVSFSEIFCLWLCTIYKIMCFWIPVKNSDYLIYC